MIAIYLISSFVAALDIEVGNYSPLGNLALLMDVEKGIALSELANGELHYLESIKQVLQFYVMLNEDVYELEFEINYWERHSQTLFHTVIFTGYRL